MYPDFNHTQFQQELKEIQAESIGWIALDQGAYLHRGAQVGKPQDSVIEIVEIVEIIEVVGVADASMAGTNVLWLV